MSNIEWTDRTWNPVTGCTKVSQGCKNCYAEGVANRKLPGHQFDDRTFTEVRCHPERLDAPLRWRKPVKVFVNSMSDLFHQDVPNRFIESVFGVMAMCPQHTFQILTKRPERMREFMSYSMAEPFSAWAPFADHDLPRPRKEHWEKWPLSNVWLGVSVEDQDTANERIPLLLETPAAVRFVSAEPLLEDVTIFSMDGPVDVPDGMSSPLHWVIVGGESGPGARPFDVQWARSIVEQCKAIDVPVFVKQLGARPVRRCASCNTHPAQCRMYGSGGGVDGHGDDGMLPLYLNDRKGGDISEWPADLRVREFPRSSS